MQLIHSWEGHKSQEGTGYYEFAKKSNCLLNLCTHQVVWLSALVRELFVGVDSNRYKDS